MITPGTIIACKISAVVGRRALKAMSLQTLLLNNSTQNVPFGFTENFARQNSAMLSLDVSIFFVA